MMSSVSKIALLSHVLPPSSSGQAVVLHRILRNWPADDYCLLSSYPHIWQYKHSQANLSALPGKVVLLDPERSMNKAIASHLQRLRLSKGLGLLHFRSVARQRAQAIVRVIREERCEALVACSGDPFNLYAGYLASRWTGLALYPYMFDWYAHQQWKHGSQRLLAPRLEPVILKSASVVIVPNEALQEEFRERYSVEAVVIHNPYEDVGPASELRWPFREGEIRIVFTGAVYSANYDPFRRLLAALRQVQAPHVRLHLYTEQPQERLAQEGISGPEIVFHAHLPTRDVIQVQREADVLFLPLAFESSFDRVIKTSAPGKMGEYLASGRPILAHAPQHSYVSDYFLQHDCGVVVDQADTAQLAQGLQDLLQSRDLREKVVANARERAQLDFSLPSVQEDFRRLFRR